MDSRWPWKSSPLIVIFLICFTIFYVLINILQLDSYINKEQYIEHMYIPNIEEVMHGFVVKTSGCSIPDMNPFDNTIKQFIVPPKQVKCKKLPPLFESNTTSIYKITKNEQIYYLGNETESLECCYQYFSRQRPENNSGDDGAPIYSACIPFNYEANIEHEFIKVICTRGEEKVYVDFFSFVPKKIPPSPDYEHQPLNVIIIGLDAISRLNFLRQMPETAKLLEKLGFIQFKGYNRVGDNTFPNLIPLLTGMSTDELEKGCWKDKKYFDNCPFIWKEYSKKGFLTSYAEDCSWMGTFNYIKKGFSQQPTDYYWTFFNKIANRGIGNTHMFNVNFCIGGRYQFETMTDYIKKFLVRIQNDRGPFFSFFWSNSMSHDYLNQPKIADDYYYDIFTQMKGYKLFENSFVIILSDHGMRWGDILSTYQGKLEQNLPILMLRTPKWYKQRHPLLTSNLDYNSRRLVTPYDVFETLNDMLNPFDVYPQASNPNITKRGYSLFTQIPENRTCEAANISVAYCTCQDSVPLNISDAKVVEVTHFAIAYLNGLLGNFSVCTPLKLDKLFSARLSKHAENFTSNHFPLIEDYEVHFRTKPGGALFDATVRSFVNSIEGEDEIKFQVMGTIGRTNLYGDQSRCISDYKLKLYCFCKEFLA